MPSPLRRFPLVLVVALLLGVFVAACGSDDDEGGSTGASTGSSTAAGEEMTPVAFQLSWLPGGDNLGFWAGKAQGYFEEEGIDLDIKHSNDPTLSIKAVASGQVPMGIAYTGDILYSASRGQDVVALYALTENSPFGLISLGETGLTSAEDLAGKRIGVTSLPTDQAYFDAMLKDAGLTRDDVKVVDPGQAGVQQVIQGNLDATSAIINFEPSIMEAQGIDDYDFTYYADYGAPDPPFFYIVANPDWLADNEDVAKRFVAATKKSFDWTTENVDEAAELFVEEFPDQDPELQADIWTRLTELQGDGSSDMENLGQMQDFFVEEGLVEKPVELDGLFTNDYLP